VVVLKGRDVIVTHSQLCAGIDLVPGMREGREAQAPAEPKGCAMGLVTRCCEELLAARLTAP
jgi:hypothetical protein